MKKILSLVTLFCIALFPMGCNKNTEKQDDQEKPCNCQRLKINIGNEPSSIDPRRVRSLNDINLVKMFMDGLTRPSKEGSYELALAEKVSLSDDQLTYTFHLKPALWSNGDAITAHDFVHSWKKSLSPDFLSDYVWALYPIKNAKSIKEGKLPMSFLGVEAPDDHTLVIHLERPIPYMLDLLSMPIFFPVNSHVDKVNPKWAEHVATFVGSGPFCPTEWGHHNKILARRNDHYWDKNKVKLSEIEMVMVNDETGLLMFQNGELHWQGSPHGMIPSDALAAMKKEEQIHSQPFLGTYWIRLNVGKEALQNPNLRKALGYAIDRRAIVEHVTQGNQIPTTSIVPASMGLQNTPYFHDHDVAQAKKYLCAALADLDLLVEEMPPLKLTYASNDRNHRIAQALQDQWREALGLHIELEALEPKIYFSKIQKQDYMMAAGSWIADFNDPVSFLEVFRSKTNGTNNTNWEDAQYAQFLEESYKVTQKEQREDLLARCEKLILDAMPVIPIFTFSMLYVKDERVQDVVLTDLGNLDFKWAYLEKVR